MSLPSLFSTSFSALFSALIGIVLLFSIPVPEAEAKRLGGGKSSGIQRQALPQKPAPQRNAEQPARNNDAAAAPAGAAGAAGAAAGGGARSWLGPVAGIAAGLGLAALASYLGLGEEFASLLLIALLVVAALLLFRWLTSRARPAVRYAEVGPAAGPSVTAFTGEQVGAGGRPALGSTRAPGAFPPGFDADAFARQAKLNFLRLQAANDVGNLDDLREFTTPELFAEIQLQLAERGGAEQRTEVEWLEADVLECAEEAGRHLVSVRFTGRIREDRNAPASDFVEVWHLTRPADGSRGWVVAGIQQMDA